MIICKNCNHENPDNTRNCEKCGGELLGSGLLMNGVKLDKRYTIKRMIKAGGMGAVYEAIDERFNTICAVKEMLEKILDAEQHQYFVDRFKTEAQMLHELKHPNLPNVTDYFVENGRYYLVMDYIEGKDLQTLLKEYPNGVPEETVIEWSMEVLDALHYLHTRPVPIVYRDLKPANLMKRDADGRIMLIDFGIARTIVPGSDTTKTIVGTPAFASQEMYSGKPEPRSDIYSLGATMHAFLTGVEPLIPFYFNPVREMNPSVSETMEAIVMKALMTEPDERFSSAEEMKSVLYDISSGKDEPCDRENGEKEKPIANNDNVMSGGKIDDMNQIEPFKPSGSLENDGKAVTEIKKNNKLFYSLIIFAVIIAGLSIFYMRHYYSYYEAKCNTEIMEKRVIKLYEEKKYERAIIYLSFILNEKPESEEFWILKGDCYFNLNRFDEAIECYGKALYYNPNSNKAMEKKTLAVDMKSRILILEEPLLPEMVFVKGGEFTMGSEKGKRDEKPLHKVKLDSFYIGKYEVTNEEFCIFLNSEGNKKTNNIVWFEFRNDQYCGIMPSSGGKFMIKENYEKRPAVYITCYGAKAYCDWISRKTGKLFRLPTEAEWEYASRGGTESEYYWGDKMDEDYSWYKKNAGENHHIIGQKKANPLGLYDMSGNVWEWVSDFYGPYSSEEQKNPTGPSMGNSFVARGGSWNYGEMDCRSASRSYDAMDYLCAGIGFRMVKSE